MLGQGRDQIEGLVTWFNNFWNKWIKLPTRIIVTGTVVSAGALYVYDQGSKFITESRQRVLLNDEQYKAVKDWDTLVWYYSEIGGDTIQSPDELKTNFDKKHARRWFADESVDLLWEYLDGRRPDLIYDENKPVVLSNGKTLTQGNFNEAGILEKQLKIFWKGGSGPAGTQEIAGLEKKLGLRTEMAKKLNSIFSRAEKVGLSLILENPLKAIEAEKALDAKALEDLAAKEKEKEAQKMREREADQKAQQENETNKLKQASLMTPLLILPRALDLAKKSEPSAEANLAKQPTDSPYKINFEKENDCFNSIKALSNERARRR